MSKREEGEIEFLVESPDYVARHEPRAEESRRLFEFKGDPKNYAFAFEAASAVVGHICGADGVKEDTEPVEAFENLMSFKEELEAAIGPNRANDVLRLAFTDAWELNDRIRNVKVDEQLLQPTGYIRAVKEKRRQRDGKD